MKTTKQLKYCVFSENSMDPKAPATLMKKFADNVNRLIENGDDIIQSDYKIIESNDNLILTGTMMTVTMQQSGVNYTEHHAIPEEIKQEIIQNDSEPQYRIPQKR